MKTTNWIIAGLLLLAVLFSALTHLILPWQSVFRDGVTVTEMDGNSWVTPPEVRFWGADTYYQLKIANDLSQGITTDYQLYFKGLEVNPSLFTYLIVGLSKFGWNMDVIGALIPPITSLILIPIVFLIGLLIFGKWPAVIGATLLAVLPGEYLGRLMLGNADYHCLETLFMALFALFTILAIKYSWKWWIAVAVTIALYFWTWAGAFLSVFILILFLYAFVVWRLKIKWTLAFGFPLLCVMVAFLLRKMVTWGLFWPDWANVWGRFADMFLWKVSATLEEQPLFMTLGNFDPLPMWSYYNSTLILSVCGLVFLYRKLDDVPKLFFIVWSIVLLLIALAMRRFGYYYALPLSIFCGWLFYWFITKISDVKMMRFIIGLAIVLSIYKPLMESSVIMQIPQMSNDWAETLEWTKVKTPEDSVILSWWDYGYQIAGKADRSVITHGGGGLRFTTAYFLTSQTEDIKPFKDADINTEDLKSVDYVILDQDTVMGKFWAIEQHARKPQSHQLFYDPSRKQVVMRFTPEYYRSLSVRMFMLNGQGYKPEIETRINYLPNYPCVTIEPLNDWELVFVSSHAQVKVFKKK